MAGSSDPLAKLSDALYPLSVFAFELRPRDWSQDTRKGLGASAARGSEAVHWSQVNLAAMGTRRKNEEM